MQIKNIFLLLLFFSSLANAGNYAVLQDRIARGQIHCAEFFHVYRPLTGGLIVHEFIAALVDGHAEIFGLPKGKADLRFFENKVRGMSTHYTRSFGKSCGNDVVEKLQVALTISEELQENHESWSYYLYRMGIAPVLGRPCALAADRIENALSGK